MNTFLTRMAPATMHRIARNLLGAELANRYIKAGTIVAELAGYCRASRLNAADLRARYPELADDAGLRNT